MMFDHQTKANEEMAKRADNTTVGKRQSSLAKFVRVTLGTTAVGLLLSAAGLSFAGQHGHTSESAPHRCSGCVNGTCIPRSSSYGHYQSHWRRWPGSTDYEGYKKRKPAASVPEQKVPEPIEEMRIEPRTRSDRPLDPEPGNFSDGGINFGGDAGGAGIPDAVVPGAGSLEDPNNPFNQEVPNSDLPTPNEGNDGFGLPDVDAGGGNDLFNPAPNTTPSLFDNAPTTPDAEPLFPGASTLPTPTNLVANTGPIRSIKNRRLSLHTTYESKVATEQQTAVQQATVQQTAMQTAFLPIENGANLANANAIPRVSVATPDVPQFATVGGDFIAEGFAPNDLLPPVRKPEPPAELNEPPIEIDQVTFDDPVSVPASMRELKDVTSHPNLLASAQTLVPAPNSIEARQHAMPKRVAKAVVARKRTSKPPTIPSNLGENNVVETASLQAKVPQSEPVLVPKKHPVVAVEIVKEEVLVLPNGNPLRAQRRIVTTTKKKPAAKPTPKQKAADATLEATLGSLSAAPANPNLTQSHAMIMAPQRTAPKAAAPAQPKTNELVPSNFASKNLAATKRPEKTKATPVSTSKSVATSSSSKPSKTKPKTSSMSRLDSTRTLSSISSRSLRDTLRKNPLR